MICPEIQEAYHRATSILETFMQTVLDLIRPNIQIMTTNKIQAVGKSVPVVNAMAIIENRIQGLAAMKVMKVVTMDAARSPRKHPLVSQ